MEQVQTNTAEQRTETTSAHKAVITRRVVPAIDVFENEDEFMLVADVPGLGESDLELAFERNVLSLSGAAEIAGGRVEYRRAIAVPDTIDAQGIDASLERGVLSVRLPKRADLKPRRIAVKAG